ncbi:MAG: hypothetical protein M3440_08290 [Chloroflexota bacterium]|nr:hypothetical protein [Chloroflexota bacterium]
MTAQTKRFVILVTVAAVTIAILLFLWLARREPAADPPIPRASPSMILQSDVPLPQQCKTAPRSASSLLALLAQSTPVAATPLPSVLPHGRAADPGVAAAIISTYVEATACANAGDFARAFSLYSDDYVRSLMFAAGLATELDPRLIAVALSTPNPAPVAQLTAIVSIDDVQQFSDGRVSARILTKPAAEAGTSSNDPSVVVFARQGDRWLIDEIIRAPGIATPATGVATPS